MPEIIPRAQYPTNLAARLVEMSGARAEPFAAAAQGFQGSLQNILGLFVREDQERQGQARNVITQLLAGGMLGAAPAGAPVGAGEHRLADMFPGLPVPKTAVAKARPPARTPEERSAVPIDDLVRQAAETLGYKVPETMKTIDPEIGKALVTGASALKNSQARVAAWTQRITGTKDKDLLLDYRRQIMQDFTIGPDDQQRLLRELDGLLHRKLVAPAGNGAAPAPAAAAQPGLPGLKVLR